MENISGGIIKNKKVFKSFFEEFFTSLVLFCNKYINDEEKAADIAQDSFIKLWKSEIDFTSKEKVKSYLYTTSKNNCLNIIRRNKIESEYLDDEKLNSEFFFRDNIIEEETYAMVYRAIETLAPQSKRIILMAVKGYANQEIAERLDISVNSVRTLKKNAYKRLKGLLKDYFYHIFLIG